MRPNKLGELLWAGQPTLGTHLQSMWFLVSEAIGHTEMFAYTLKN